MNEAYQQAIHHSIIEEEMLVDGMMEFVVLDDSSVESFDLASAAEGFLGVTDRTFEETFRLNKEDFYELVRWLRRHTTVPDTRRQTMEQKFLVYLYVLAHECTQKQAAFEFGMAPAGVSRILQTFQEAFRIYNDAPGKPKTTTKQGKDAGEMLSALHWTTGASVSKRFAGVKKTTANAKKPNASSPIRRQANDPNWPAKHWTELFKDQRKK
ncbi:hypothetical protein PT974_10450 [Cladobotryum mycophilum]|uniref:DUF8040 domain-containing protein n=1 Tax=Cladobotryum mycophilum TaxID=491253 RepID=A0ABR0SAS5_9HYPO